MRLTLSDSSLSSAAQLAELASSRTAVPRSMKAACLVLFFNFTDKPLSEPQRPHVLSSLFNTPTHTNLFARPAPFHRSCAVGRAGTCLRPHSPIFAAPGSPDQAELASDRRDR